MKKKIILKTGNRKTSVSRETVREQVLTVLREDLFIPMTRMYWENETEQNEWLERLTDSLTNLNPISEDRIFIETKENDATHAVYEYGTNKTVGVIEYKTK